MKMGKIKILHIIKTLGLGGAEVNLFNLVNAIDRDRFEIHVAYSSGGEIEDRFRRAGVRLFKFADQEHKLKSLATLGIIGRLAGYIHHHKIDIVHTHTFNAQVWGGTAARLAGAKVVEHVHDLRYFDPQDFIRRRGHSNQYQYVKYFKHLADRVVVLTKQNHDFLLQYRLQPKERIREFQNGIPMTGDHGRDDAARERLLKEFNLPENALIILTPVRLAPEKNTDLIIRIAAEVIQEIPQAYFLIAGDGPLVELTREAIKNKHLQEHVRLIGFHQDIHRLLKGTDIFLLPSFLELHSIAILEAMSMKVPVVVSQDVGCNSEFIVSGVNGVLCNPFVDHGWPEALIKLLKDPALRAQIGQSGFETCKDKFDIASTIKNFESLYAQMVQH